MHRFHQFALVGLGGALGALARLGMTTFGDPGVIGTFIANIAGSAALGLLTHEPRPDQLRWFAATGFCGGLTTMSTFAVELVTGVSVAPLWIVAAYGLLSVGLGLAAFSSTRKLGPKHPMAAAVLGLTAIAALTGLTAGLVEVAGRSLDVTIGFLIAAGLGAGVRGVLSAGEKFDQQLIAIAAINIVGAFALAVISGLPDPGLFPGSSGGILTTQQGADRQLILGVGALGAFTTFSTAISQIESIAHKNDRQTSALVGIAMFVAIIGAAALGRLF